MIYVLPFSKYILLVLRIYNAYDNILGRSRIISHSWIHGSLYECDKPANIYIYIYIYIYTVVWYYNLDIYIYIYIYILLIHLFLCLTQQRHRDRTYVRHDNNENSSYRFTVPPLCNINIQLVRLWTILLYIIVYLRLRESVCECMWVDIYI